MSRLCQNFWVRVCKLLRHFNSQWRYYTTKDEKICRSSPKSLIDPVTVWGKMWRSKLLSKSHHRNYLPAFSEVAKNLQLCRSLQAFIAMPEFHNFWTPFYQKRTAALLPTPWRPARDGLARWDSQANFECVLIRFKFNEIQQIFNSSLAFFSPRDSFGWISIKLLYFLSHNPCQKMRVCTFVATILPNLAYQLTTEWEWRRRLGAVTAFYKGAAHGQPSLKQPNSMSNITHLHMVRAARPLRCSTRVDTEHLSSNSQFSEPTVIEERTILQKNLVHLKIAHFPIAVTIQALDSMSLHFSPKGPFLPTSLYVFKRKRIQICW